MLYYIPSVAFVLSVSSPSATGRVEVLRKILTFVYIVKKKKNKVGRVKQLWVAWFSFSCRRGLS